MTRSLLLARLVLTAAALGLAAGGGVLWERGEAWLALVPLAAAFVAALMVWGVQQRITRIRIANGLERGGFPALARGLRKLR